MSLDAHGHSRVECEQKIKEVKEISLNLDIAEIY
jgi:hypothetical protein